MNQGEINKEKTLKVNAEILEAEIIKFQREMWERNRFCECGADNIYQCACSPEKKRRFRKRRSRKTNEKFSERLDNALKEKVPEITN